MKRDSALIICKFLVRIYCGGGASQDDIFFSIIKGTRFDTWESKKNFLRSPVPLTCKVFDWKTSFSSFLFSFNIAYLLLPPFVLDNCVGQFRPGALSLVCSCASVDSNVTDKCVFLHTGKNDPVQLHFHELKSAKWSLTFRVGHPWYQLHLMTFIVWPLLLELKNILHRR